MKTYANYFGAVQQLSVGPQNWATGKPVAGSTVQGTNLRDQMVDNTGGATLVGLGGDDTYLVADEHTKIVETAGGGIDTVYSWVSLKLPDYVEILELDSNLTTGIAASTGSLVISNGSRNNLISGFGNDILSDETADAQNIFVFNPNSGKDVIYGFTATGEHHDLLRINNTSYSSFDSVKAALVQVGNDVQLSFSASDVVLIKNVKVADLTSDDFLLPFSPVGQKLTFDDEFNSLSLWNASTGSGTWKTSYTYGPSDGVGSFNSRNFTGEQEIYVDPTYAGDPSKSSAALGLNPFSINNGVLSITASRLTPDLSAKLYDMPFASGVLTTEKTFAQTYGYFEIKAEVPMIQGMFPAFWLLPTSRTWPPEIDIMENVSKNYVSGGSIAAGGKDAFYTAFPDGLTGMHTYGLLWTDKTITWYVDGQAIGSIDTPADMHQAMYLIVNLAVGTAWAGSPDPSFSSASLNVDYVRVYSLDQLNVPLLASFSPDSNVVGDGITNVNHVTLNGTALAGSTVQIFDGATLIGSATANGGGAWSFATSTLVNGGHVFTSKGVDAAGNVSAASAALNVTVDTVAPGAPTIASFSTDSGVVGDGITNDNTLTLSGTAAAGSTVQVFDGATQIGTATANGSGAWSFATATLSDGAHAFTSKAMDAAGNVSAASSTLNVTVDTVAPGAPAIASFSTDSGVLGDGITNDNTLTLNGPAAAGSTVQVFDGATQIGTATANGSGAWSFATATLSDGSHAFTSKAVDAAGNVSAASTALNVTVDTVAPGTPAIASFSTDSGVVGDGITSDNTLTLTGTAAAGSTVRVFDGAVQIGTATANSSGAWTFATATLVDGVHAFTSKAMDVAGNVSAASTTLNVTVDTVAPGAPAIASFSTDSGVVGDGITSDNTLTLTGTAAAGSTVRVFDGATQIGTATTNGSGAWTFTTATLSDGSHAFTSKAVDVAGNVSIASVPLTVLVDTIAPSAPNIISDAADSATSMIVTGTAEAGTMVKLFENTTLLGSGMADAHGVWNIKTGQLSVGAHDFTATATDTAGNVSAVSNVLDPVIDAPANHTAVVTASDYTATHNQSIAVSSLFSVSDADGDTITKYQLFDSTPTSSSGHFVVGGVAQGTIQAIDVTAAQLTSTTFQSGSGSDDLWVRAFDGTDWGSWKEFHVNAPVNHTAVATAVDFKATHNQNVAVSSLFSVSDADGDAITKYQFWDSTTDSSSGHFAVSGVVRGADQAIDVTAAQLSSVTFQSGSGSDDLWVRAFDGTDWGSWKEFHVNAPVNHTAVVTASDFTATHNQSIAVSSLFSVSDADGDAITKYQLFDSTGAPSSGHFVVNGVAQGTNKAIDVTAAQLSSTMFQSGSGSDDLLVRAFDGTDWGSWKEFHVHDLLI